MSRAGAQKKRPSSGWKKRIARAAIASALLATGINVAPSQTAASATTDLGGLAVYGVSGNSTAQARTYSSRTNSFAAAAGTQAFSSTSQVLGVRTSPNKREAIAVGMNSGANLQILCFDGVSWTADWTVTAGTSATTRTWDIAYETQSGDVVVAYSVWQSGTDEWAYRTKLGSTGCGSANWSSQVLVDSSRVTGRVKWLTMSSDHRPTSNLITSAFVDENGILSAMQWSGTAWGNEPGAALETSLEYASGVGDIDSYDVEYETLSGDVMVAWGNSAGNDGTNGVRYATCTGGTNSCTWSAATTPPTFADDATNVDLSANPDTDEMVFASLGNAGSDLQAGYWSGSAWTNTANLDPSASAPTTPNHNVTTGWLKSGATYRSIVVYRDSAETAVSWYSGNGATFSTQTDFSSFGTPRQQFISTNPVDKSQLMLTVSDSNSDGFAKRLEMDSGGAFTWTDADSGSALEANLSSGTRQAIAFAYWRVAGAETAVDVAVVIPPYLSFAVTSHTGTCNTVAQSSGTTASATSASFGRLSGSSLQFVAQDLKVQTNAAMGYTVYVRSTGPMTDGHGHNLTDFTTGGASNLTPQSTWAAGTEAVGYTTDDSSLSSAGNGAARFTSGGPKFAPFTTTASEVHYDSGPVDESVSGFACAGVQVGVSNTSVAASYSMTIIYVAVPSF